MGNCANCGGCSNCGGCGASLTLTEAEISLLRLFSQIPFLFTQVWVPGLLACFMLYKPCNEVFRIEERLQEQSKTT